MLAGSWYAEETWSDRWDGKVYDHDRGVSFGCRKCCVEEGKHNF